MNDREEYQILIDELVNKPTDQVGKATLTKLGELIKASRKKEELKEKVVDYLEETLNREKIPAARARTWCLSVLQFADTPKAAKIVTKHLFDSNAEPSSRARAWAAVCLTQMHVPFGDVKKSLDKAADNDEANRVRAMALRLLIENSTGAEQDHYITKFQNMILTGEADERLGVYRVLCHEASEPTFPELAEQEIIEVIRQSLQDENEWQDIRVKAAQSLGKIKYKKLEAVKVLTQTLNENPANLIQTACIRALAELYEARNKEIYREPLLLLLKGDRDQEIQLYAIESLRRIASKSDREVFTQFIIEEYLRHKEPPASYLDALRRIDNENAAKILGAKLTDPDLNISERASKALTELGGNEAVRILQAQRRRSLEDYTALLKDADTRIGAQFDTLMKQAHFAFYSSMAMHIIVFLIGVVILSVGFYIAIHSTPNKNIASWFRPSLGVGGSFTGLGTLLLLFYKDPFKNIGHSLNRLVRINVVFLGYVRQINQIDATFKHAFLSEDEFDYNMMKKLVTQIRSTVDGTLSTVKTYVLDEVYEIGATEIDLTDETSEAESPGTKNTIAPLIKEEGETHRV